MQIVQSIFIGKFLHVTDTGAEGVNGYAKMYPGALGVGWHDASLRKKARKRL